LKEIKNLQKHFTKAILPCMTYSAIDCLNWSYKRWRCV